MHKTSYRKMSWFKNNYLDTNKKLKILDIGSLDINNNNFNYKQIFNNDNWEYDGLDFEKGANVDILVSNIYNWDVIKDSSYDVIISGQFFEHLNYFWIVMEEINRVLKPGGYCCIIAPSSGPKHGKLNDCYRFNEAGMKSLAEYVDFEVIHTSTNSSDENPWHDSCIIAKKSNYPDSANEIKEKMVNAESEINSVLNMINK